MAADCSGASVACRAHWPTISAWPQAALQPFLADVVYTYCGHGSSSYICMPFSWKMADSIFFWSLLAYLRNDSSRSVAIKRPLDRYCQGVHAVEEGILCTCMLVHMLPV